MAKKDEWDYYGNTSPAGKNPPKFLKRLGFEVKIVGKKFFGRKKKYNRNMTTDGDTECRILVLSKLTKYDLIHKIQFMDYGVTKLHTMRKSKLIGILIDLENKEA